MAVKHDLGLLKTEPQPGTFLKVDTDGKLTCSSAPGGLPSEPPSGCLKVTNIYVNAQGKLVVEYDTTPAP